MRALPESTLGKSAIWLGAAIVVLAVLTPLVEYGLGLQLVQRSAPLIVLGITFAIAGVGTLVTGLLSMIKNKERSILVLLALLLSFFALFWSANMLL